MDSSSANGKKIIFKKLVLGSQTPVGELAESHTEEETLKAQQAEQEALQFQGDVFDQFYRPLSANDGEKRLHELASEPVAVPTPSKRPTPTEHAARCKELSEFGEALAHQIYHLAQKVRETDLDVYLSAFNVILGSHNCHDIKLILDAANEFFTEHYYTPIRDRGERPEIYHQIIKRVGHSDADRIGKIVKGLDPAATARRLWDTYHGPFADKQDVIHAALLDLTEKQLKVVREEFLLIPYRDLAKQLHSILTKTVSEPQQGNRRTIGKSEVYEHKRTAAFRSRNDLRSIRHILAGRSSAEIALIKRFYLDQSPLELPETAASIETHIKNRLLPSDAEKGLSLLEGWSARREAEEIYKILFPISQHSEIEDQLSDPRDSVDRDHTQGIGPLLRRFRKRRIWRGKSAIYHRIINAYELVAERIASLSIQRFFKTNEALDELYGFELDPSLFPSLGAFDGRVVATLMYDRLRVGCEVSELLKPLEWLDPRQCLAVQKAYECLYGESLVDVLQRRSNTLGGTAETVAGIVPMLSGAARWPLNIDLLGRYRDGVEPLAVWEYDYQRLPIDDDRAIQLAELLDHDETNGARDELVKQFFVGLSYDERGRVERSFYELTDPHVPLLVALREALSVGAYNETLILLFGKELHQIVAEIRDESLLLISLRQMPAEYVQIVRDCYRSTYQSDLIEDLLANGAGLDEDTLIERLAIVLTPEVISLRTLLFTLRKDRPQEMNALRGYFAGPIAVRHALERGYDMEYPRLRVHLKYAAARQAVSAPLLSEIVLVLEGVDPQVTAQLLECFDSVDIGGLYSLLEANRDDQRTIEECYDLLFPEATLRRSIKDMKVDLDLINETLLHLEGYYAREVSVEFHQAVSRYEKDELGQRILDTIATPTPTAPNHRIPEDINWMDEMVYQIAIAYGRLYGVDLLQALRERGVSELLREEITGRIFGLEVCNSARDLFNIIKQNKEGAENRGTEHAEEQLCSFLESRGTRHRDRLLRAYNSHWAHTPSYEMLLDDVSKYFVNQNVKKKMISILLGVQSDKAAAAAAAAHS